MPDIPSQIGRYRIERRIGQGAMGSVYLGRDPELDRPVAVKTVRDLGLEADRLRVFLERFRNEAKAAARLSHPGIVAVYDVGEADDIGPYLVFEYVPGPSLKQLTQSRGPLSPEALVRVARQLASALDTAHAAGVIHRDIKPDNILVSTNGGAKLADFGVARIPDATLTREGQFLGTPCYAAPETLDGGTYGPLSDLFSFAAVLYEAATGVRAFLGDDVMKVARAVVNDEPAPMTKANPAVRVPTAVEDVIRRGLSKDPSKRFDSAVEMANALAGAYRAAGIPLGPTEENGISLASKTPAHSSGWTFGLLAAGLTVVALAFVLTLADTGASVDGGTGSIRPPDAPTLDGSVPASGETADAGPATGRDAGRRETDAPPDAATDADATTNADAATILDASVDASASDAGTDTAGEIETMSAFDREEAAKDAVDAARDALAAGAFEDARAALTRARALDPGNEDIDELEAELRTATPAP